MSLAADIHGRGATHVLLLHGIGGGRAMWQPTLPIAAAAGCTAAALDLPGYGDSRELASGGIATMAAAVAGWLQQQRWPAAVIVGHSMGGMVAQELVATQPQLVAGLVLACTSPAFGRPGGDWQAQFVRERLAPLDAGQGMATLAQRLVDAMVAPQADPAGVELARRVMAAVPEATYRSVLAAIVAFDRRAALPAIRVPTLCLAAEHDRTAPPEVLRRMAEHIPGAEYECILGAGHIANVEQPQAFGAALAGFLRRHFAH